MTALLSNANFCRKCHPSGFDKSKPAFVYVLLCETIIGDKFTGYGITNNLKGRLSEHKRNLNKFGYTITQSYTTETSGILAQEIECKVKDNFERVGVEIKNFKWESTYHYNYKFVIEFIEKLKKDS
jgi:predicted GIY-YIG superfamily endonuclease